MKQFVIFMLLGIQFFQGQAQTIKGKVVDEKEQPIPYVNVVVQTTDSVFIAGTTTNDKGKFIIPVSPQELLLALSCIGYESQLVRLDMQEKDRDLGTLILPEAATALNEVTVTANKTIQKIDKQIIYPSDNVLKKSSSGYDLLARLMLPDLTVDPVQRTIATQSGGNVEVRINDVSASMAQVSALNPAEIQRVEYIDNPGARYGDGRVEAVINYVVKKRKAGVTGGIEAINAVTTRFGNNNIYMKANAGLSELSLIYYRGYRDYKHRSTQGYDNFYLPDGTEHKRQLEGIEVPFGYTQQVIEATYNLTKQDAYVLNVLFSNEIYDSDKQDESQRIIEKGAPNRTFFKHGDDQSQAPALDIYYSHSLKNKQKLTANLVGTYISSEYLYDYKEYQDSETPSSIYSYATDGKRYSLIGEAIYSKEWEKNILSIGIKGNTAYTKNIYTGDNQKALHMHNSSLYGYGELQGRWAKLSYLLGIGISQQQFSQSEHRYTFTTLRPSLSLSYPIGKNARARYTFSIQPSTPSLSQLSDVRQQNNDMEITGGNSELTPYRSYRNRLTLSWNKGKLSTQLTGTYNHYTDPIMTSILPIQDAHGYRIAYLPENGKSHRYANARMNLQWTVIPEALIIGAFGGVSWYHSEGTDYSNRYTAWNGGINLSAFYKHFSLLAAANTRPKSLYGYYVDYGEKNCYVQLSYTHRHLTLGVAYLYPFTPSGWTGGRRTINNTYVNKKSWTRIEDNGNMVCLCLQWKFNYGRKHKAASKTMSNKDVDSGILK